MRLGTCSTCHVSPPSRVIARMLSNNEVTATHGTNDPAALFAVKPQAVKLGRRAVKVLPEKTCGLAAIRWPLSDVLKIVPPAKQKPFLFTDKVNVVN